MRVIQGHCLDLVLAISNDLGVANSDAATIAANHLASVRHEWADRIMARLFADPDRDRTVSMVDWRMTCNTQGRSIARCLRRELI